MEKLFVATSFSGQVNDETGLVHPEFRQNIQDVLDGLRVLGGFSVFCAIEHENWRIDSTIPPEVGVQKDLNEIDDSDSLLVLLPNGVKSEGIQYEAGYAEKAGKKIVFATDHKTQLGYFNQGVVNLGKATHITYSTTTDLILDAVRHLR